MAVTAQEVITNARDLHQAFSEERTGDAILLRQLSVYKRRLHQKVTNINSSVLQAVATDTVIDLTVFDFVNGQDLGAFIYILPDGEVEPANEIDPGDRTKFTMISQLVRLNSRPTASGWMRGNRLFLQGSAIDWQGFLRLHLSIIPIPTGPTALADNFDPLPDSVLDVLTGYAGLVMARRGHIDAALPPIDVNQFRGDFGEAQDSFLTEMGLRKKTLKIKTLDVYP